MTAANSGEERRAELVSALARFRARLVGACADAGRDPHAVTLVAVTKGFPTADVATLVALGLRDIGENRDQEARAKAAELAAVLFATNRSANESPVAEPPPAGVRWHFIGQLQSNKCRSVARYAHSVHSVDRVALATALADAAGRLGRRIAVFCQVSLDGDPARGGILPSELPRLADAVAARAELELAGVMAVAPQQVDSDTAFAQLADLSEVIRKDHPNASGISAGMSGDLEVAIRHGATHVRVGSALLGHRRVDLG
ncbi:MAG: YggS family pyridoxal phosphate enzyme [Actinomycetia bacterium]|nr:YggS family pyridoxal phosphate enzyme [Actinomycetes bacterium]